MPQLVVDRSDATPGAKEGADVDLGSMTVLFTSPLSHYQLLSHSQFDSTGFGVARENEESCHAHV